MRVAACAVTFVAISAFGTELTHRWSFNGDWSDSVDGADAVKCGSYVSLYGNRVHMGYGGCTHGTGYVDLGTNMLDTAAATLEIWARHDEASKIGTMMYGAGVSGGFSRSRGGRSGNSPLPVRGLVEILGTDPKNLRVFVIF